MAEILVLARSSEPDLSRFETGLALLTGLTPLDDEVGSACLPSVRL